MTLQDLQKLSTSKGFAGTGLVGTVAIIVVYILVSTGNMPFPAFANDVVKVENRVAVVETKQGKIRAEMDVTQLRLKDIESDQSVEVERNKNFDKRLEKMERGIERLVERWVPEPRKR